MTQNTTQRVAQILLRYVVDKPSVQAVVADQKIVETAVKNTGQSILSTAQTTDTLSEALRNTARQSTLSEVAAQAVSTKQPLDQLVARLHELGATKAEIAGVVDEMNRLGDASARGGKTPLGRGLRQFGQELYLLPDVGPSTEISRGLRIAGGVSDALALTTTELVGLGVAGAAVGVVTALLIKKYQDAEKAAKEYAEELNKLAGSTSTDIRQQITALEAQRAAQKGGQDQLKGFTDQILALSAAHSRGEISNDAFIESLKQINTAVGNATNGAVNLIEDISAVDPNAFVIDLSKMQPALNASQAAIDATNGELAFLNSQLDSSAVKAADAAEAARALVEAQVAAASQTIKINSMTKEQREELARELVSQIDIYSREIANTEQNSEAHKALYKEQAPLIAQYLELIDTTRTYADQLDLEAKFKEAVVDRSDAVNDSLQDLADAQADLVKSSEKVDETYKALTETEQEHADKLALIEADRLDKEQDLRDKAADNEQEQEDKRAEKREEARADHERRLQEIEDQYQDERTNAIGNRDALALAMAEKERAKARKKEELDYADRLKKIDKALDDQTKAIEKRLREQLKSLEENARKSIDAENRRYAKEYQDKLEAHNRALQEEKRYLDALEVQRQLSVLNRQFWDSRLIASGNLVDTAIAQFAVNLTNYANQIAAAGAMIPGGGGGYGMMYPSPAGGGAAAAYTPSPTAYTQNTAVNFAFAPTINATTERQITEAVDRRVYQMLQATRGRLR